MAKMLPQEPPHDLPIREEYLAFGRPDFGPQEEAAINRVFRSGWIGMGPETIQFEKEMEAYIGCPNVVTVNSCTSGLFLSLVVSGVTKGDEVICPSLTWCSTANAALYLDAVPVFCDVDQHTLLADIDSIVAKLTDKTKAVVVVHMGGLTVDVDALRKALPDHITIIEDAAHAIGAQYPDGKMVGSKGNLTCFSFYANKNLSTGEGGAIAVSDPAHAEHLRSLRQHGLSSDAWKRFVDPAKALVAGVSELGYKMNFTDMQAALGRVQLARLPELQRKRQQIAAVYMDRLNRASIPIESQSHLLDEGHAKHLFVITLPLDRMSMDRNEFLLALRSRNIGACIHYVPLHTMPLYQNLGKVSLPNTEFLMDRILTLPISSSMTVEDAEYVMEHFCDILRCQFK